jgi:hypothetical protein
MKVSAVVTVLAASFAFVAGATIERATHEAPAKTPTTPTVATSKVAPERVTTLVTLPEITVRPSAEDLALAEAQPVAGADDEDFASVVPDSPIRRRSSAGRGGFDMPYYSFGKVLPQVSQD